MKISIFGLGYVGCVSAGCLAKNEHKIIGVDIDKHKVELINNGIPTIVENQIDELILNARNSKHLEATDDTDYAIANTDISIICVSTPGTESGHLNLNNIYKVAENIGRALTQKKSFHTIAIRSTVPPGTGSNVASIIEQVSNKQNNIDFAIVSNPEFLREGSAVKDYFNPAFTLLGSDCDNAIEIMSKIYNDINAPIIKTSFHSAEIIKYVNNSFHALKITFANEVGNICKNLNIDSHEVMNLLCLDKKLNISPYYLRPGFAYGGSCLPKDLGALVNISKGLNIETPVITNIARSNEIQKDTALKEILKTGKKKIGILGLSFKAGTDDLRESPIVEIAERLVGKGYEVRIYDNHVQLSRLMGSNKSYIDSKLPHLSRLLCNLNNVIDNSEVIVISNNEEEYQEIFEFSNNQTNNLTDKTVIDLVKIRHDKELIGEYNGLCW